MPAREALGAQGHIERCAVVEAGVVVDGKSEPEQRPLERPPASVVDGDESPGGLPDERGHLAMSGKLPKERLVGSSEDEAMLITLEAQAAPATGELADLSDDVSRNVVLCIALEGGDHRVGREARRGGVPDGKRRHAVGVNMLRRLLEFGEAGQRVASLEIPWRVHLGQDRAIGLDDERVFWAVHRNALSMEG